MTSTATRSVRVDPARTPWSGTALVLLEAGSAPPLLAARPPLLRRLRRAAVVEAGDVQVLVGTSTTNLPCRGTVRLTGPVRVVGHDRCLLTSVEQRPDVPTPAEPGTPA